MNIMKLIPSQDIAKTRWTFSDRDQAAILFNLTGLTLTEKTAYLQELGSQTKDQVLAKEIEERLEADAEIKTVFFRHALVHFTWSLPMPATKYRLDTILG